MDHNTRLLFSHLEAKLRDCHDVRYWKGKTDIPMTNIKATAACLYNF
ncbi:hypothetical protein SXCC_00483 [Gluconacetobacter sp. SXCC-1]|nr:hypothetical protein SXCC_00483 [Gluconacetobacter sp. SXCC-1]